MAGLFRLMAHRSLNLWRPSRWFWSHRHGATRRQSGLVWLGTHPQLRRRGIGSQLTGEVARLLVGSGVTCIHVQASPAAVGLYQALGFRCNGWLELWGHEPLREQ